MSAESNKVLCAILSAVLVYLLSSFTGELIYHKKEKVSLSYYIEDKRMKKSEVNEEQLEIASVDIEEIKTLLNSASFEEGKKFAKKNCASCHDFSLPPKNKIGPSLAAVLNREIASLDNYKYSNALKSKKENWDLLNLYFFLEKPKEWAKGTKMSYKGIKDQVKLINTIKYLETVSIKNAN